MVFSTQENVPRIILRQLGYPSMALCWWRSDTKAGLW